MCTCPDGYVGQFCESCAPGYRHDPSNGGPFARCIPCNCNGHADVCDIETGMAVQSKPSNLGKDIILSSLFQGDAFVKITQAVTTARNVLVGTMVTL